MSKPKKIPWRVLLKEQYLREYEILDELITEHHDHLFKARVVLAFNTSWQEDVDGRLVLGRCKKVTDLEKELMPYDYIIMLNQEFWTSTEVTDHQRRALLDHELCHTGVVEDRDGEPKVDEKGRTVYRTRKHTLEEFHEIVDRYGLYKQDLEEMWRTMQKSRNKAEVAKPADATGLKLVEVTPREGSNPSLGTPSESNDA